MYDLNIHSILSFQIDPKPAVPRGPGESGPMAGGGGGGFAGNVRLNHCVLCPQPWSAPMREMTGS